MTKAPQSLFFGNTMKIIRVKQVFYVLSLLFLSIPSIAFSQGPRKITIAVLEFEGNGVPDQTGAPLLSVVLKQEMHWVPIM